MAIYKPIDGEDPNDVVDGLYRSKAFATGRTLQRANNNKGKKNPNFTNMNDLVAALDLQYDNLTEKDPWITYANNIIDEWSICMTCSEVQTGKKLYRQYNFNRSLIGKPAVAFPIDDTEFAVGGLLQGLGTQNHGTPINLIIHAFEGQLRYGVVQLGMGLSNFPALLCTEGLDAEYDIGSQEWTFWNRMVTDTLYKVCYFTPNGAPGLSGSAFLTGT